MHEMLYQKDDEVAQQVAEILLDELETKFHRHPLEVVCDSQLLKSLKTKMQALSADKAAVTRIVSNASPTWEAALTDIIKSLNSNI